MAGGIVKARVDENEAWMLVKDELFKMCIRDRIQLVNDFLNISKIHAKGLRASMTSYLLNMPPKQMVAELIAGIKRSEVATKEEIGRASCRERV